jgi:hypothetical protein
VTLRCLGATGKANADLPPPVTLGTHPDQFARIGFGKRTAQTLEQAKMKMQNIGSDFDDFLAEEGMLEEVTAV